MWPLTSARTSPLCSGHLGLLRQAITQEAAANRPAGPIATAISGFTGDWAGISETTCAISMTFGNSIPLSMSGRGGEAILSVLVRWPGGLGFMTIAESLRLKTIPGASTMHPVGLTIAEISGCLAVWV